MRKLSFGPSDIRGVTEEAWSSYGTFRIVPTWWGGYKLMLSTETVGRTLTAWGARSAAQHYYKYLRSS